MKYSEVLGASFRALKSGVLWLYSLTALAAIAVCFGIVAAGAFSLDLGRAAQAIGGIPAAEVEMIGSMLRFYATLILGGLLSLPVFIVVYGGMIHMSDAVLAGRPASAGECWRFGMSKFGRLLGIEALLYLFYMLAVFVMFIPIALIVVAVSAAGAAASDEAAIGGLIGGVCLGYLVFFVAIMAVVLVYTGVESLSSRYGLIGDRTLGDAVSSGWQAFRARWKQVVVFGLIVMAITYAWSFATSIVLSPLSLVAMPWSTMSNPAAEPSAAEVAGMMDGMIWVYMATFVLMLPSYVFMAVAWTAFFRRLTGLEAPPVTPVWASFPGSGYPQQPPQPPAVEYPGTLPPQPQPPAPPAPPVDPGA